MLILGQAAVEPYLKAAAFLPEPNWGILIGSNPPGKWYF